VAGASDAPATLRVATLNVWRRHGDWPARRAVLADGLRALKPDVVAFQEAVKTDDYDQVLDLLGPELRVSHQPAREPDGSGISIASRWPLGEVQEVQLPSARGAEDLPSAAYTVEVSAPEPVGTVLAVTYPSVWHLDDELTRERQAVVAARFVEELVDARPIHAVLLSDLNATPDAASIRFWTGRQSLDGTSVCYRDAWESTHPDDAGHTFSPVNPLATTGDGGDWALELGRRIDYVLVRCGHYGPTLDVRGCERIFDAPVDGVFGTDHFGVLAELCTHTPDGRPVP
jgi:endonuclease/exonuclease/phosphatase family metal-dependent hydrolase